MNKKQTNNQQQTKQNKGTIKTKLEQTTPKHIKQGKTCKASNQATSKQVRRGNVLNKKQTTSSRIERGRNINKQTKKHIKSQNKGNISKT